MTTAQAKTLDEGRVMDLLLFLEWLDCRENEVKRDGWTHPDRTHEETARLYLAQCA